MKFLKLLGKIPKMSLCTFLETHNHNLYKKLIMVEFCNDYNSPNFAEERPWCKIYPNQTYTDQLQITDA